ncbi:V-type H+-transporting ATPase subunit E [Sporothrix brasiliensis 5110]|uniref:V-type H+-transporting ATPase subunit E n=1 Tax=Sporothrix brasiliensis 5110 TaxID=1398154 RepID=A0A0C2IWY9_9PEZI|nr:V-type H+-transporting ATPase subunit E [Sporothrix brasiliensis 5110]KIH91275.1 V-type H+-transporting ATPase subunit E [Sporothrix brasiliensis 5110]
MSQIHALSDDQVGQELRKMTAFIRQEATEKAHEIETKANEEFAIEKSKLVRQETDAIDAAYEKKFKQATMSQQITRSTVANKTRLQVLTARQELLDDLFEAARKKLASEASSSPAKYKEMLTKLVLEGAYAMQEPKLQIRARKADAAAAKDALAAAAKEYKKETGDAVELVLDTENELPASSAGGVIIVGGNGKITIDNTLEARLALVEHNALPVVRETLFGKNVNRKFYD